MWIRRVASLTRNRRTPVDCGKFDSIVHTLAPRWHSRGSGGEANDDANSFRDDTDHSPSRDEVLLTKEDEGVLTLTLNRPKQRNALNRALLESLQKELERAAQHPRDIRAIVLQGSSVGVTGNVFSSGHDLKELQNLDEAGQRNLLELCCHVMQLLPRIPQPTIAAVDGLATAAGCQLVAACDLAIGNPMSGYSTPGATTIGLFCHTPAVPLVRSIGLKRAMDMLYTGRTITAPEAMQYGLITSLAANPQKEAAKLARQIATQSAGAMQMGKRSLYQQASESSLEQAYQVAEQAMLENLQTQDAKSGMESFVQKKVTPTWEHR
jgi:enoyl-CoA hydratase/carnithine racemase